MGYPASRVLVERVFTDMRQENVLPDLSEPASHHLGALQTFFVRIALPVSGDSDRLPNMAKIGDKMNVRQALVAIVGKKWPDSKASFARYLRRWSY